MPHLIHKKTDFSLQKCRDYHPKYQVHQLLCWIDLGQQAVPMKNRLKIIRAERDWTQANLADELGVSRQTVNAIEKGKFDPSLPLAFKVGRLFEKSIEDIFRDEPSTPRIER